VCSGKILLQSKIQNCHIISIIFMAFDLIMNKILKNLVHFFFFYILEYSIIPDFCAQIISACQFYINSGICELCFHPLSTPYWPVWSGIFRCRQNTHHKLVPDERNTTPECNAELTHFVLKANTQNSLQHFSYWKLLVQHSVST